MDEATRERAAHEMLGYVGENMRMMWQSLSHPSAKPFAYVDTETDQILFKREAGQRNEYIYTPTNAKENRHV